MDKRTSKKFKITYRDSMSNGELRTTYYSGTENTTKQEVIDFFGLRNADVTYFKVEEFHFCPICKKEFTGYGNNPAPLNYNEPVCDECNIKFVIPARLKQL